MVKQVLFIGEDIVSRGIDEDFDIVVRSMSSIRSIIQRAGRVNRHRILHYCQGTIETLALAIPLQTYKNILIPGIEDLRAIKRRAAQSPKVVESFWLYFCMGLRITYLVIGCMSDSIKKILLP